ncbi:MAG: pyridoxal phosphate-dependent aminotransferase [Candidatus Sumerlaeaceae bacterium]
MGVHSSGNAKRVLAPLLSAWGDPIASPLALALEQRRRRGEPVFDFIQANPQEHGFEYPPERLAQAIADACVTAHFYKPDPRGQIAAREAVAAYHGSISPEQVVLTPGTSMAYWYTFRLLARPGGNVLCPAPTYPLFDDLARLAGLQVRSYHLEHKATGAWRLNPEEIEFQITPHTCALVLVSPHNPTGMVANIEELCEIATIAMRHRLPIVFDEVFCEFLHDAPYVPRPSEFTAPLCVTLNGLSKMLSLPGLKAGWMVVEGSDRELTRAFVSALEYASDTFLPVSEIVQAALPALLSSQSLAICQQFAQKYRHRMSALVAQWQGQGFAVSRPEGGVYLPVPLPAAIASDESVALALLEELGIYCHAGSSYAMPTPHLITTCVPRPPWPIQEIADFFRSG